MPSALLGLGLDLSAWIGLDPTDIVEHLMLYAMLAASAVLIFVLVLVVPAKTHRLARLFRAQEVWAELMDRESQPCQKCPLGTYDAVQLAVALEVNRIYQAAGSSPVTLVSADRSLNDAATAEGLTVENPNLHP